MSSVKSCEIHDRLKFKGFCALEINAESVGP